MPPRLVRTAGCLASTMDDEGFPFLPLPLSSCPPAGFHGIDMENGVFQDLYLPVQGVRSTVTPHAIIPIPRSPGELLLCYNSEGGRV